MKKLLIAGNVLLLGIIFFQACNNKKPPTQDPGPVTNGQADKCPSKICSEYPETSWPGHITTTVAQKLFRNYTNDWGKSRIWDGESRSEMNDTKSVWFPLETIKKFIWRIENNKCKNNCPDSLGIRIYFAKYPKANDPFWENFGMTDNIDFANHHTLFMVPTYYKHTNVHQDFNPFVPGCPALTTLPAAGSPIPNVAILLPGDAQNHGSLIPPRSPEGTAFN